MQSGRTLIFVYNSDSEDLPDVNDHMSRMAGPGGGHCSLYAVTHSPIGMKKEWKRFIQSLGIPVRFLARDTFSAEFPKAADAFPSVFLQTSEGLFAFITADEINHQCRETGDLIRLVSQRIAD